MQYTTNYNLITVEGTDVVNPLVQMNPNFTDIDAAMFANKQATIGTATEITVGTVHSITRANTDSNYFRFTATSNWTTGDSMNVDGVAVSVFLTDGTTPGTGSYVINSEVFGMISGTRVTLFLASAPVTSLDADQVTFDPTGTSLSPADTDVDKALRDIDAQINKGEVTVVADGVKTQSQLLDELFAIVDYTKISAKTVLYIAGAVFNINFINSPTSYTFSDSTVATNTVTMNSYILQSLGSEHNRAIYSGGQFYFYAQGSNVEVADRVYKVIY